MTEGPWGFARTCRRCRSFAAAALLLLPARTEAGGIEFLPEPDAEFSEWAAQWAEGPCALDLRPTGVLGLDQETALLYGELTTGPAAFRSLLLRTTDGGTTWKEVSTPVMGSSVLDVLFKTGATGWALVGWVVEGPGDLALYGTRDAGRTWRKLSDVPKRSYLGQPEAITFSDESRGRIEMLYEGGTKDDGLVVLDTSDGGRSWRERKTVPLAEYERTRKRRKPRAPFRTPDGSEWRVDEAQDFSEVQVQRRFEGDASWTTVADLPGRFDRAEDGTLLPCGEDEVREAQLP